MTALESASTEITVRYRSRDDGWHLFTSDDMRGLFVASPDLKKAFNDVPRAIAMILKLDHGLDCIVQPKLDYAGFIQLKTMRERAHEEVEKRTAELIKEMEAARFGSFPFTIGSSTQAVV